MFLLVSVHHVGAHPGGHQHGVSILGISINLGKTFLRISQYISDSGLYLLNGFDFDFDFDLFWMAWHWKPAIQLIIQTLMTVPKEGFSVPIKFTIN